MAQEEQVTTLKDALDDGLEDWERQAIQKGKAAAEAEGQINAEHALNAEDKLLKENQALKEQTAAKVEHSSSVYCQEIFMIDLKM